MIIQLVKAIASDARVMQKMQIESFAFHFERYQDVDTSPVKEPLEKMISRIHNESGCYFKIIVDDIHVGCVWVLEKAAKMYRIGIIYILPEYQCKGFGKKVLAITESMFPDAKSWELDCPADLSINRHCYEKAGYLFTGETKVINEKLTLVFYRKEI